MAKIVFVKGHMMFSGKLGDKVYKVINGEQVVSSLPKLEKKKPSEKQIQQRQRFKRAILFARSVADDPIQFAAYQLRLKKHETVWLNAIREYMLNHRAEE
jgi:hypothetical protein